MRVCRRPSRRGAPRPRRSGLRSRRWPRTSGRCSCCASSAGSRTARSQLSSICPCRPCRCCSSAPARSCAQSSGPGSARVGGLIPIPHWLLGLADRFPAGLAGPRVGGNRRRGCHRHEHRRRVGRIGCRAEAATGRACATRSLEAGASSSRGTCRQRRAKLPCARQWAPWSSSNAKSRAYRRSARAADARPEPELPAVAVVEGGGAEPAAPVAPSATLGIDDGAPAPALVPAVPSVSQAPIVPVVTTHLPPLPEPPVDVVVPALPDLPIVQPPLPPALPGGAEVTIPEVASLRIGP